MKELCSSETPRAAGVDIVRARKIIEASIGEVGKEQAGIINTFGRTLATDVEADAQVPCCDTASTDGYAAHWRDTSGATESNPRTLSVLADCVHPGTELQPGTVVRVHRGDHLPRGADSVVALSRAFRPDSGPQVLVMSESARHENVRPAGSNIAPGETVLSKGTLITGREMAVLASLGRHGVEVSRKPRVGVITAGSNVVDVTEELGSGQVRNSSRYALVGGVLEAGCDLGRLVHTKTGRVGLEKAITECAACDATIVAVTAKEKHESVLAALSTCGNVHFERVHMEPGAASAFAMVEGRPVFVAQADAILETFEAIIRPGLLKMLGRANLHRPTLRAVLRGSLRLSPTCAHFIKATTTLEAHNHAAEPLNSRKPGLRPWMQPNSLIYIPHNTETVKRGDLVNVLML